MSTPSHSTEPGVRCMYYFEECNRVWILECGHQVCGNCARKMIHISAATESRFRPQCCGLAVTEQLIRFLLDDNEYRLYQDKVLECTIERPIYCAVPSCSFFIAPRNIEGDYACCPNCGTKTHVPCRAIAHPGQCREDRALGVTLKLAKAKRWRRCYWCQTMVEHARDGCKVVTCQ
ncbi:hypothetical protein BO82DRAFT_97870 [Aspergillus uvarum CBS 121591]|uniref:RING-type domain-containing protein n=1 Tax=Aspergillus uvarum CBS 121591 TaxID=1448315 RepID=A0A319CAZ2_9EURO|nr:hypothetical protein BO82DRAFT_97870 [Aspergillus uvarum CBS 121591]PYH80991.1 hypothetical protein BO82DRAFT_97870 [Aspergillus uvarum CBS 121591]